eukprot:jgi/Ulvmu1/5631/UM023_0171.1
MNDQYAHSFPDTQWIIKNHVFKSVSITQSAVPTFSSQQLMNLKLLHGKSFQSSLALMKPGQVSCLEGEDSGRRVYKVQASHGDDIYTVLPWQFCTCQAFTSYIRKGDSQSCKHQVVVQAWESSGVSATQKQVVSDRVISDELRNCICAL